MHSSYTDQPQSIDLMVNTKNEQQSVEILYSNEEHTECPICRTDKPLTNFYIATECLHNYCRGCLQRHYRGSVKNGIVYFECMDEACSRKINKEELFMFLDSTHQEKYAKFVRNVELAKDSTIRWCITAGCDTPIHRNTKKETKLQCPICKTFVCYNCAGLYFNQEDNDSKHLCHRKLEDSNINSWVKQSNYDVDVCPKCTSRIEKLEGCNHMKCSYCKFEFCWLCRKEFKKGHYDPSNIFSGCPGGENASKRPSKCTALCNLMKSCCLMCCLPFRICCWRMNEQGFPWCCCWCCCD